MLPLAYFYTLAGPKRRSATNLLRYHDYLRNNRSSALGMHVALVGCVVIAKAELIQNDSWCEGR